MLGLNTVSSIPITDIVRNLGEKTSFIELDTSAMTDAQMQELEIRVNAEIRAGRRMYPTLYEGAGDPALKQVLLIRDPTLYEGADDPALKEVLWPNQMYDFSHCRVGRHKPTSNIEIARFGLPPGTRFLHNIASD